MISDVMGRRVRLYENFSGKFSLYVRSGKEWITRFEIEAALSGYTDGSVIEGKSGHGMYGASR